jgi:hypothetical protein
VAKSTNRFDALTDERYKKGGVKITSNTPKSPPIFVSGVQNIQSLKELLVAVTGDDFEPKVLNGNQVKIQPKTADKYKTIIQATAEKHIEFHTYQPKEDKLSNSPRGHALLDRYKRNQVCNRNIWSYGSECIQYQAKPDQHPADTILR